MPGTNLTRDEAAQRSALLDVSSYAVDLDLTTGETTFGSTTTIRYDPSDPHFNTPGSPSDSVLLHEMAHARNNSYGENMGDQGPMTGSKLRDDAWKRRWSNIEEHDVINNYDNAYRKEQGLPLRKGHSHLPR